MHLLLLASLVLTIPEGRQPMLAHDSGKNVYLAWGQGGTIFCAHSADGGQHFSSPVTVASVPALALGRHRGPRVAVSGRSVIVAAVVGTPMTTGSNGNGMPQARELTAWHSVDMGATWSAPVRINDVDGATREGLFNMTGAPDGTVAVEWLDLRRKHGTQIWGSWSRDGGRTWAPNTALYAQDNGTVCQCCHPSVAAISPNSFAVMFRNVVDGNRDFYLLHWQPGQAAGPAAEVGENHWNLNICPMDGGGVVALPDGHIWTAWRRDHDVLLAPETGNEQVIGQGHDVAMAADGKTVAIAYVTPAGAIALYRRSQISQLDTAGSFPALLALHGGQLLAAWEKGRGIAVEQLAASGQP